nr:helix-turn-helix transcriptional regulator [Limosilactobacillus mucosae]
MTAFSERLTKLREERGWSKTYVAKEIGLSSMQTYANWEYGRTEPDFDNVTKLADLFNVSTDLLLGRKTPKPKITVEQAMDTIMSADGKEPTEHDRKLMESIIKAYLDSQD